MILRHLVDFPKYGHIFEVTLRQIFSERLDPDDHPVTYNGFIKDWSLDRQLLFTIIITASCQVLVNCFGGICSDAVTEVISVYFRWMSFAK